MGKYLIHGYEFEHNKTYDIGGVDVICWLGKLYFVDSDKLVSDSFVSKNTVSKIIKEPMKKMWVPKDGEVVRASHSNNLFRFHSEIELHRDWLERGLLRPLTPQERGEE